MVGGKVKTGRTIVLGIVFFLVTSMFTVFGCASTAGSYHAVMEMDFQPSENWHSEVADDTGWVGIDSCIAIDANNSPHISHYDEGNKNLKYAYWNGGSRQNEIVDSDGDVGEESGIAIDGDGNPHISYIDNINCALKYARKIGGSWNIEEVYRSADGNPISGSSIALDSNGHPCIVFDEEPDDDVRYAYWDGSEWKIEYVCAGGEDVYLVLDSNDTPHVSFLKDESRIYYATRMSGAFDVQVVDSSTQAEGDTGIAVDSNNHPHIVYNDYGSSTKKYARWEGTSWNTKTIASNVGNGEGIKIAVDSLDRPHIVYDDESDERLKYTVLDGGSWTTETIDKLGNPSIAIDDSDRSHVSHEYTVGDDIKTETAILKYSTGYSSPVYNVDTREAFTTIRNAINDPDTADGHTIRAMSGTYNENIVVDKSLTICSVYENPANTTVQAANPDDYVFHVTADYVNISGFTITGAGTYSAGIYLDGVNHCNITENRIINNDGGGMYLSHTSDSIIAGNNISNNCHGIFLDSSSDNLFDSNIISHSFNGDGISMDYSTSNTLMDNTIESNAHAGIGLWGSSYNLAYHNNLINNSDNGCDDTGTNSWDNGTEGNYWSDYTGTDGAGDGIGDVPYSSISGGAGAKDNYPLITRVNEPPIADFTYSPEDPFVDETITFDASNSTDPDGMITNYEWDFGDGNITNTADEMITHSYSSAGDYDVILTVTDNGGAIDSMSETITITTFRGDLNSDGEITPADAAIALEIAAGSRPFDDTADMNSDGVVTSLDALMIMQAGTAAGADMIVEET